MSQRLVKIYTFFYYGLYLGQVDNVGKNKMFLENSFSVARVLILSFFILLVVLASILDISGIVENMSSDYGDNELLLTTKEDQSVVESGVTKIAQAQSSVLENHQNTGVSENTSSDDVTLEDWMFYDY